MWQVPEMAIIRQMMKSSGCFLGCKSINLLLRTRKRLNMCTNVRSRRFVLTILHLNVEGLSANKTYVITQYATGHKALGIRLQETICANASITKFHTGWLGFNQEAWSCYVCPQETQHTLVDEYSERSAIKWLCINIGGCEMINVVGSVVKCLEHCNCNRNNFDLQPTRAIMLCPLERHFTALSPAWWSCKAGLHCKFQ